MSETQEYIGKIHDRDLPRDAVHVAVVQVTAGEQLFRGDHITKDGIKGIPEIGIVDPFITETVKRGDKFYLFLYPNTVTGLTHHYFHPVLDSGTDPRREAEDWLKDLLNDNDTELYNNYDWVIKQFKAGRDISGFSGDDPSWNLNDGGPTIRTKFWDSLEIVTGVKATEEQRAREYFSCSC
jgi:hypothetical protein